MNDQTPPSGKNDNTPWRPAEPAAGGDTVMVGTACLAATALVAATMAACLSAARALKLRLVASAAAAEAAQDVVKTVGTSKGTRVTETVLSER